MNKKMTKTLVICMMSIFLFAMTACQYHGERRHSGYGNSEGLPYYIASKLDLDSGQETQLTEMLANLEETREELGRRDELRIIFVEQLKNKELDEDYLRQEITEFIREMESSANEFITDLGSFHASLNEQQKGKLADIISRQKGPKSRHN
jgi:hypothetical protein